MQKQGELIINHLGEMLSSHMDYDFVVFSTATKGD